MLSVGGLGCVVSVGVASEAVELAVDGITEYCHAKIGPTLTPRPILDAKNGPPQTIFGCQKWSHLAKTGTSRT